MALPGDIVHVEAYEVPATGATYLIEVLATRSGRFVGSCRAEDGPHAGECWERWPSAATTRGAVTQGKRMAQDREDITPRAGIDYDDTTPEVD